MSGDEWPSRAQGRRELRDMARCGAKKAGRRRHQPIVDVVVDTSRSLEGEWLLSVSKCVFVESGFQ